MHLKKQANEQLQWIWLEFQINFATDRNTLSLKMVSNFNETVDTTWLLDLLTECQLEQFYSPIKDELQITRLAHFDYVVADDLTKIGLSKPRIRQLMDHVKKKKTNQWRKNILAKLVGGGKQLPPPNVKKSSSESTSAVQNQSSSQALTCLIHEV